MRPNLRVGVAVLDFGRPLDAEQAAASARDPALDVRVLIVENGTGTAASGADRLRLPENRGFAGGMNAGLERLLAEGCDRILLLNNDAVLDPGCLQSLATALDDPALGAVGPVILRASDGRVESRGLSVDLGTGRVRMEGQGEAAAERGGLVSADALSGAVMMLSRAALERIGLLDERYFFSFEDVDWCVRARRAGFEVAVVLDARARHGGSRTIGASPARLYYSARNHVAAAHKLEPRSGVRGWLRDGAILGLNLAHALKQQEIGRMTACRAVVAGYRDALRGRFGSRPV